MSAKLRGLVCVVALLAGVSARAAAHSAAPVAPHAAVAAAAAQSAASGKAAASQAATSTEAADAEATEAIALMAKAVDDRDIATVQAQLQRFEGLWPRVSPKLIKKLGTSIVTMFKDFGPRDDFDLPLEPQMPGDAPRVVEDDGRRELLVAYRLAAGVLYDKPEGRALMQSILKVPHVRGWPEVVAILVEGLGYQPDAGLTAVVKPYLDDPSPVICGAAAKALSQLHDEAIGLRREAVAALVKAYSAAQEAADKERRRSKPASDDDSGEPQPFPAAERLSLMDVPFGLSLQKLTRQSFPDPAAWQAWFDQHGKDATW